MTPSEQNTWVGRALVEELARLDTPLVCLAPGARCAPLSMALGATDRVPWTVFVDERAAAFHALGVGRATGRPAVVITTSGTAVGNLVPAAMEADQAGIPILFLTADRPADLRQTASNQTVRQSGILSPLVRFHADLPCSDPGLPMTAMLSTLDQAVHQAIAQSGPAHLNLQFREPLAPVDSPVPSAIASWWASEAPWVTTCAPRLAPSEAGAYALAELSACPRGLVVVGSLPRGAQGAVSSLIESLGWPAYGSPDSGVSGDLGLDSALSDPDLAARLMPDAVLWIGGSIVSKRIVGWLRNAPETLRLVSVSHRDARVDPAFRVTERHVLDYDALAAAMHPGQPSDAWTAQWRAVHDAATHVVAAEGERWSELSAAHAVMRETRSLFVGASLPVRLCDWMGADGTEVHVEANRGASGIDGVLATATGWARHVPGPVRVLLGDLTCLHDQGSLPLVRDGQTQAVVFNNCGGSIFGMLPFGAVTGFDTVFRNAHNQAIAPLAQAHGLTTATVHTMTELQAALDDDSVDLIEAWFEHDDTIEALKRLHSGTCAHIRRTWGLS